MAKKLNNFEKRLFVWHLKNSQFANYNAIELPFKVELLIQIEEIKDYGLFLLNSFKEVAQLVLMQKISFNERYSRKFNKAVFTMTKTLLLSYYREDNYNREMKLQLAEHYLGIIKGIGEDVYREGLLKTPERAAKAMQFLTSGYGQNAAEILRSAMFKEDYSEMVLVKDIELYSLCEHHLLPFIGKAHVAYIPDGYVVGLSKIPRVVDVFARRLQVQERLTLEIMNAIQDTLKPLGVAVVIEAMHMCMMMRGVQKQNSSTTTSAFTGEFQKQATRQEFLNLIGAKLH